jgi:hypothetical protein
MIKKLFFLLRLLIAGLASVLLLATFVTSVDAASVPSWVKNNAGWWADGQIDDGAFVSGVQYLIEEGIITVPSTTRSASTSDAIPDWVKNNAGWWAAGTISENDFLNGIQYLIKMGIMQVSSSAVSDDMSSPSQYQSTNTEESKSSSSGELDSKLEACQDKETKREIRDCEKAVKEDYIVNQFKTSGSANQVGPITYYYVANWQEESRNTIKQFNNVAYTATGQALVNIKVLAENTGSSDNVTMMCTSPAICNYSVWDGGHKWVNSGSDFTSGNVVLKPGQERFLNILWGPAIGYGSYEDFIYDSGKDYYLRISEPFGKIDIPLNLVVVP